VFASAGAAFGAAPVTSALLSLAGRFEAAYHNGSLPGLFAVELELRWLPPVSVIEDAVGASVQALGAQLALCHGRPSSDLGFDVCIGAGLRFMRARLDADATPALVLPPVVGVPAQPVDVASLFEPRTSTPLASLSLKATGRMPIGGPWSLFAGVEVAAPLGGNRLVLQNTSASPVVGTGNDAPARGLAPFFNAQPGASSQTPETLSVGGAPLVLYEPPTLTATLRCGLALEL
jgi:hypothetical protein